MRQNLGFPIVAPSAFRQLPPGLREGMSQGSVAGPKEGGFLCPVFVGQWTQLADSVAEQRAFRFTFMPQTQLSFCQTVESELGALSAQIPPVVVPSCPPPPPVSPLPLDPCFPTDFGIVLVCNNPLSLFYQTDLKNSNTQLVNTCPAHRYTPSTD